ncbi:hypothetical protein ANCCAN_20369, partial [Ancylostoma caninum]
MAQPGENGQEQGNVTDPAPEQRQDPDETASYSGASTSRLASTPVEKSGSSSSREESVKEVKIIHPEGIVRQSEPPEATGQSVLQRVFHGLVRRREVGTQGDLVRRNVQASPPAPASPTPKTEPIVYVEKKGKFRAMKKNLFQRQQEIGMKKVQDDIFSSVIGF